MTTENQNAMASSTPRLDTAGIAALLGLTREYVTDCVSPRWTYWTCCSPTRLQTMSCIKKR